MASPLVHWIKPPRLREGRMLLAFSGWMDGGDVSTGSVRWLIRHSRAELAARLDSRPFYLLNMPGSMEVAALLRPEVRVEKGEIRSLTMPQNELYTAEGHNLLLFVGKEPNLQWERFADAVLELARDAGVTLLVFVGTFAGATPHTRQPRLYCSVSDPGLKSTLARFGLRWSDYEGPASFATYLMTRVAEHGLKMASLVAEIPAYVSGANPASIETVIRKLSGILGVSLDLTEMRRASTDWELKVTAAAEKDPELLERIRKLEADYDAELVDTIGSD